MSRDERAKWIIIGAVVTLDAIWAYASGILFIPHVGLFLFAALAFGIKYVYTNIRPDERLAELASSTAILLTFIPATTALQYLATAAKFPLIDEELAAIDRALHLDWLSVFAFVKPGRGSIIWLRRPMTQPLYKSLAC